MKVAICSQTAINLKKTIAGVLPMLKTKKIMAQHPSNSARKGKITKRKILSKMTAITKAATTKAAMLSVEDRTPLRKSLKKDK